MMDFPLLAAAQLAERNFPPVELGEAMIAFASGGRGHGEAGLRIDDNG